MNNVFLCLGGNLGNRLANINTAVNRIEKLCGSLVAKSNIYETEAWGSNSTLKFINQVIKIKTNLSPQNLLQVLLDIEISLGRERTEDKNSDRTIDIDILFFNAEIIKTQTLLIPHPRLHLRNFVLKPLAEIAENYTHPQFNKTINQLVLQCPDSLKVNMFIKN